MKLKHLYSCTVFAQLGVHNPIQVAKGQKTYHEAAVSIGNVRDIPVFTTRGKRGGLTPVRKVAEDFTHSVRWVIRHGMKHFKLNYN
jgi:hypothetical protein